MKKLVYSLSAMLVMAGALAAASTSVTGTLKQESGKFVLVDEATQTRFEIRGDGLGKLVGSHVKISGELINGNTPAPIVELSSATKVAGVVTKTAAAGVKTGVAKSTLLAVGSVAVGGAVGGLYAADVIGGEEEPASRR